MIKTLHRTLKLEKEKFMIPKSVQQAIPIQRIWPDGIFQSGRLFSKSFRFTDINYSIAILLCNMNYIAKKIALQEKNILNHADLYLDYNNRIAFHKNRKINLTVKEFDILFFLASYPGQVFTHRQIYETVWGKEYFCDEGNVTAHIGHIRKKIELDPRNPVFIQTVRGIGYKFAKK